MHAGGHDNPGDGYPIEPPLPGIQGPDRCQDQAVAHAKLNQVPRRRLISACCHDGLSLPASGSSRTQPRWGFYNSGTKRTVFQQESESCVWGLDAARLKPYLRTKRFSAICKARGSSFKPENATRLRVAFSAERWRCALRLPARSCSFIGSSLWESIPGERFVLHKLS